MGGRLFSLMLQAQAAAPSVLLYYHATLFERSAEQLLSEAFVGPQGTINSSRTKEQHLLLVHPFPYPTSPEWTLTVMAACLLLFEQDVFLFLLPFEDISHTRATGYKQGFVRSKTGTNPDLWE